MSRYGLPTDPCRIPGCTKMPGTSCAQGLAHRCRVCHVLNDHLTSDCPYQSGGFVVLDGTPWYGSGVQTLPGPTQVSIPVGISFVIPTVTPGPTPVPRPAAPNPAAPSPAAPRSAAPSPAAPTNAGIVPLVWSKNELYAVVHRRRIRGHPTNGLLASPGGAIDRNEQPIHAAIREAWEEARIPILTHQVRQLSPVNSLATFYTILNAPAAVNGPMPDHAHEIDLNYNFAGIPGAILLAGTGHALVPIKVITDSTYKHLWVGAFIRMCEEIEQRQAVGTL